MWSFSSMLRMLQKRQGIQMHNMQKKVQEIYENIYLSLIFNPF